MQSSLKRRGESPAIWLTLGYFSLMEALQAAGYLVIDECGSSSNQAVTLLSYLHIVFQPFFINAFAMELLPGEVKQRLRRFVYLCCAGSAAIMLAQLMPFDFAGACRLGKTLCGSQLCTVSGEWHIAWDIPYNGLLYPLEELFGVTLDFPSYIVTAFLLPLLYGAWRFALFHALAGPIFASFLTGNPNEMPAIWCLFSIGILFIALSSPIRRGFTSKAWWLWPKAWRVQL